MAAGCVPLAQADMWANFLIVAIPIIGFGLFNVGECAWRALWLQEFEAQIEHREPKTPWEFFGEGLLEVLRQTAVALALLLAGLVAMRRLPNPGLIVLGGLVTAIALYGLWLGRQAVNAVREPNESWTHAFWRTPTANVGIAMLGVFFWTGLFMAANAGLRFYGL